MASAEIPNVALHDDNTIPALGLGVAELSDAETERAVSAALEMGIRLIDTAAVYGNEEAVGRAIAASGIPRAEISSPPSWPTPTRASRPARMPSRSASTSSAWSTWTST